MIIEDKFKQFVLTKCKFKTILKYKHEDKDITEIINVWVETLPGKKGYKVFKQEILKSYIGHDDKISSSKEILITKEPFHVDELNIEIIKKRKPYIYVKLNVDNLNTSAKEAYLELIQDYSKIMEEQNKAFYLYSKDENTFSATMNTLEEKYVENRKNNAKLKRKQNEE